MKARVDVFCCPCIVGVYAAACTYIAVIFVRHMYEIPYNTMQCVTGVSVRLFV